MGKQDPWLFGVRGKGEAVPWWTAELLPQGYMEAVTLYNFDGAEP